MAYPDYQFKAPQGAAFSVAKIVSDMERLKILSHFFGEYQRGWHLCLNYKEIFNGLNNKVTENEA